MVGVIFVVGLVVVGLVVVGLIGVVVVYIIVGHRNLSLKFGKNWVKNK